MPPQLRMPERHVLFDTPQSLESTVEWRITTRLRYGNALVMTCLRVEIVGFADTSPGRALNE
jgi:hypothetical protein